MKIHVSALIFLILMLYSSLALAERLAVKAPLANIRSGPGTTYDILWNVGRYHPLLVLKKTGNWVYFRDFEGDMGWIHKSLVGKVPTVITAGKTCNIRQGAGTSFKVLFTVAEGIPFRVLKKKGNWIHIQHADGDIGWIHRSLVW